ncbi:MAG: 50S ribosomal protein L17 [Dehalococcoidia bacterium]|nr:50S ribosomal protein L17 [Dehalococcoidia bacterium]
MGGRQFGRHSGQRQALFRNLITDVLRYNAITTTEAKAKEIRPMVEKIITWGKEGTVHARRQAARVVYDKDVLKRVFNEIAPAVAARNGGYTRITKLGFRLGDGAAMARIELVDKP